LAIVSSPAFLLMVMAKLLEDIVTPEIPVRATAPAEA
jgi:hypothetical protein